MKLQSTSNPSTIQRGGIQSESTFTIKTTAKAFDILSSGLYSDKILAVVRELSCNAYDSHIQAKKAKTPFEVHLPSSLEPYFSVKDFGVGLSDEQIHGLYTTYFDSTKTDSNAYIGALGLGSKSPFSYSKAFEVISRFDKTIRTYGIFINEHGIPTVAMMNEAPTDLPNGLEVKLTVEQSDFFDFQTKLESAMTHFAVKPTVTGLPQFRFNDTPEPIIKKKNWSLLVKRHWNAKPVVIQGNVQYVLDLNLLKKVLTETELRFVKNFDLWLYFNIGELEVAASREAIQYDEWTTNNIKTRIQSVVKELTKQIVSTANKHRSNMWDATVALNILSADMFKKATGICELIDPQNIKNPTLKKYLLNKGKLPISDMRLFEGIQYTHKTAYGEAPKVIRRRINSTIVPDGLTVVMFNDMKVGGVTRIAYFLEHKENLNKTVICFKNTTPRQSILIRNSHKKKEFELFEKQYINMLKDLGNPTVVNVSSLLPYIKPRTQGTSAASTTGGLRLYESTTKRPYSSQYSPCWEYHDEQADIDGQGYYVELQHRKTVVSPDGNTYNPGSTLFESLETLAKKHNDGKEGTDVEVYGVNKTVAKKLAKTKGWINIFDYAKSIESNYRQAYLTKLDLRRTKQQADPLNMLLDSTMIHLIEHDAPDQFRNLFLNYIEKEKEVEKQDDIVQGLMYLRILDSKVDYDAKQLIDNEYIQNRYPMLCIADSYKLRINTSVIFDYIRTIDEKQEKKK